jgi:hypothetical protein
MRTKTKAKFSTPTACFKRRRRRWNPAGEDNQKKVTGSDRQIRSKTEKEEIMIKVMIMVKKNKKQR